MAMLNAPPNKKRMLLISIKRGNHQMWWRVEVQGGQGDYRPCHPSSETCQSPASPCRTTEREWGWETVEDQLRKETPLRIWGRVSPELAQWLPSSSFFFQDLLLLQLFRTQLCSWCSFQLNAMMQSDVGACLWWYSKLITAAVLKMLLMCYPGIDNQIDPISVYSCLELHTLLPYKGALGVKWTSPRDCQT